MALAANRDFPLPPKPVTDTAPPPPARWRIVDSSSARPTKGVRHCGAPVWARATSSGRGAGAPDTVRQARRQSSAQRGHRVEQQLGVDPAPPGTEQVVDGGSPRLSVRPAAGPTYLSDAYGKLPEGGIPLSSP